MRINVTFQESTQARENAFWLAILTYVEPLVLWFGIYKMYSLHIAGFASVALLTTLLIFRFMYTSRTFTYPLVWGVFLYAFTDGQLLPWWIDVLGIALVVGGRFWLLSFKGK
jgi:hypothetical protein